MAERGSGGAAASSLLLSACRVYFPPRDSEQVSLSLGKARRRQPICSQRRALPRASPGTAAAQQRQGWAGTPAPRPHPIPKFQLEYKLPGGSGVQNSPVSGCCVRVLSACGPAWERRLGVLLWLASLGLNPVVLSSFPFPIFPLFPHQEPSPGLLTQLCLGFPCFSHLV